MANAIESVLTIGKSPADTMAVVIGADSNNTAGTAIGAMNIANSLASTVLSFPRSAWECIETRRSDND